MGAFLRQAEQGVDREKPFAGAFAVLLNADVAKTSLHSLPVAAGHAAESNSGKWGTHSAARLTRQRLFTCQQRESLPRTNKALRLNRAWNGWVDPEPPSVGGENDSETNLRAASAGAKRIASGTPV